MIGVSEGIGDTRTIFGHGASVYPAEENAEVRRCLEAAGSGDLANGPERFCQHHPCVLQFF